MNPSSVKTWAAGVVVFLLCGSAHMQGAAENLTCLCREAWKRRQHADARSGPHTHVFGCDATHARKRKGAAAWPGAHIAKGHYAEDLEELREGGLADEGENGSRPNN